MLQKETREIRCSWKNGVLYSFWILAAALLLMSCGGGQAASPATKVRIHNLGDVKHLNVITATDNQSTIMSELTHQYLYMLDPKTYEYKPVLVKERASQGEKDGKVTYDFEIRPEAKWDNGTDITAEDVIFTLKLIFTPDVESVDRLKPYLDYIETIEVDASNPKKFKVVCAKPYMSAETSICGNLPIMPAYVYDPKGMLKPFSVKDMIQDKSLQKNKTLKEYARFFNSNEFKYDILVGSGPYRFTKWDKNERVVLTRKKDWWGDKVNEPGNVYFTAEPEEIVYVTITDLNTAVVALRGQSIDAMQSIPNKQFIDDLSKDERFLEKNYLETPILFAYDYIGLNMRDERLADVRVRKALAHAMNVDQLVKSELGGLGERMNNIIHPMFKERFNDKLEPYDYDLAKAKALFKEAGWEDTNENGILDKEIDGERVELEFDIYVNNGNDRRKSAAIIFQNNLKQVGVKLNLQVLEWSTFLDKLRKRDFGMYIGGWAFSPDESDPAQIWHSESYADGSNYVGFGTPESDKLIDDLRETVDDRKRFEMYKELQEMIHRDVPYIFLVVQKNRVGVSRKYDNVFGTGLRQGFTPSSFSVAQ